MESPRPCPTSPTHVHRHVYRHMYGSHDRRYVYIHAHRRVGSGHHRLQDRDRCDDRCGDRCGDRQGDRQGDGQGDRRRQVQRQVQRQHRSGTFRHVGSSGESWLWAMAQQTCRTDMCMALCFGICMDMCGRVSRCAHRSVHGEAYRQGVAAFS